MEIFLIIALVIGIAGIVVLILMGRKLLGHLLNAEAGIVALYQNLSQFFPSASEEEEEAAQPGDDQEESPESRQKYEDCVDILKELGCSPRLDEGMLVFDYQGFHWVLRRNVNPEKIRIELPGIMQVSAEDVKLPKIIEICNDASRNLWGANVFWVVSDKDEETPERTYHFFICHDGCFGETKAENAVMLQQSLEAVVSMFNQLRYDMNVLNNEQPGDGPVWSMGNNQYPPANLN